MDKNKRFIYCFIFLCIMGTRQQLFIKDMKSADITRVERTLQSSHYCEPPLLASNENLATAIAADSNKFTKRGISPEQVADRLDSIIGRATTIHVFTEGDRYLTRWEGPINTNRGFAVSHESYRAGRPGVCPYTEENARDIACGRSAEEYTIVGKRG